MHLSSWIGLLSKEAEMLALFGAIGFGPAALLRGKAAVGSRIALAPVLGLALGSAVMGTAVYVMPMKIGAWLVLVPLALGSLTVGIIARRRAGAEWMTRARASDLLQIGLMLAVVAFALNYSLAKRDSLGPVAYSVGDAAGYVPTIDGLRDHKIQDKEFGPPWDITAEGSRNYAAGYQQLGLDSLAAANNTIFGWGATEMETALMITALMTMALGLFASVRGFTETRTMAAMLGGVLAAGPLSYELLLEASESAVAGLALVVPFGMVGVLTLRDPCLRNIAILGLLAAGIQTLYPVLVPVVALWVGLVLLVLGVRALVRRRLTSRAVGVTAYALAVIAVLSVALTPVAASRNKTYWDVLSNTDFLDQQSKTFPRYDLPVSVIPSYVLQTREFYYLTRPTLEEPKDWALSVVAPIGLCALALFGAWRYRRASVMFALFPGAALLAYSAYNNNDCSYCLQRGLLVMGPASSVLIATGVAALATWRGEGLPSSLRSSMRWRDGAAMSATAILAAIVVLGLAGHKTKVMSQRMLYGAYVTPHSFRELLPSLAGRDGPIMLEKPGASAQGLLELSSAYHGINENTSNRLSINTLDGDHNSLAYLGGVRPLGPRFTPGYRWVVTRVGDVRTPRRTVARSGPYALQERTAPLDVTIGSGVIADLADRDPLGRVWVEVPDVRFLVAARTPASASLRLTLDGRRVQLVLPRAGRVIARRGRVTEFCVPVNGRGSVRRVRVRLKFRQPPGGPAPQLFGLGVPPMGLRVAAVSASTRDCTAN